MNGKITGAGVLLPHTCDQKAFRHVRPLLPGYLEQRLEAIVAPGETGELAGQFIARDDRGEPALKGCVPAAVQIFESLRAVVHHHVRVETVPIPLSPGSREKTKVPTEVLAMGRRSAMN